MEHRTLGRTGLQVGTIGLGTEHIEPSTTAQAEILRLAVEAGVNYVDLLYVEPDYWEAFGPVLRPHREQLVLAAHWGGGSEYGIEYCKRTFANVLDSVGNDYVDVAMMTMIDDGARTGRAWREASLSHLRQLQAQGRVGWIGGSAHDPVLTLHAVEEGWLDVLMFPINMVYHGAAHAEALIRACQAHDVGLVAMKAYHGGTLLSLHGKPSGITPAQCLSYVFSLPVATAVPGPRNAAEWRSTLDYLHAGDAERAHEPVVGDLAQRFAGQCVFCHHCLPCPEGIEIGWMLWYLDQAASQPYEQVKAWYDASSVKASACVECGVCLERCPFGVDIPAELARTAAFFAGTPG